MCYNYIHFSEEGNWGSWDTWTCVETCGETVEYRNRTCEGNADEEYDDCEVTCEGPPSEEQPCFNECCPRMF